MVPSKLNYDPKTEMLLQSILKVDPHFQNRLVYRILFKRIIVMEIFLRTLNYLVILSLFSGTPNRSPQVTELIDTVLNRQKKRKIFTPYRKNKSKPPVPVLSRPKVWIYRAIQRLNSMNFKWKACVLTSS